MATKKSAQKKTVKKAVRPSKKKAVKKNASSKKATKKVSGKTEGKTVRKTSKKTQAKKSAVPSKKKVKLSKDMEKIREALMGQRETILEEIGRLQKESLRKSQKDASGDLSGYSFHMADMATDLYDREFLLGLAEGEREMLYQLEEAIKTIDEGKYGKCEMCNNVISKQRLKAMPQAKYCIKCQEQKEQSFER